MRFRSLATSHADPPWSPRAAREGGGLPEKLAAHPVHLLPRRDGGRDAAGRDLPEDGVDFVL